MNNKTAKVCLTAHNIYEKLNIHAKAVITAATLFMTVLFVSLCFNNNVHTDEAFSMQLIQNDYAGVISGTMGSQHPPLYYLIAKTAALLFPTETYKLQVQKFVTIVPVTLTLLLGSFWVQKKTNKLLSSLLFGAALSFLICTMEYAVQVRMYSWGLFFVTMCGLEAYDAYISGKLRHWFWFGLFGVAAAYTHNYAFVSAVIICGLLFLMIVFYKREHIRPWLITVILMFAAYLPWFFVLISQFLGTATSDYWIPEITGETILGYFTWAFGLDTAYSTVMILLLFILGGVVGLIDLCRRKDELGVFSILCWLVPTLTASAGVIVSLLTSPIYYNRYVYPAMGLLCIFFALSWSRVEDWYQLVLLLFCCVIGVERYKEAIDLEYLSTNTDITMAYLEENLTEDDIVVYNWSVYRLIYEYYVDGDQLVYIEDVDWDSLSGDIYFFYTYNCEQISQSTLDTYGLIMEDMGEMGVEQNVFVMYHVYKAE
ncbi:MAG: hypothetical protein LUC95_10160 [Lachnospiraceae bacterium]|nr:hypothetical protein [Lachnospiraceae bacterium]